MALRVRQRQRFAAASQPFWSWYVHCRGHEIIHFGGIKQSKSMGVLNGFSYNNAFFWGCLRGNIMTPVLVCLVGCPVCLWPRGHIWHFCLPFKPMRSSERLFASRGKVRTAESTRGFALKNVGRMPVGLERYRLDFFGDNIREELKNTGMPRSKS